MSGDLSGQRPKTASELLAELQQNPEYIAREQRRKDQMQENRRLYAIAAEPVLAELEDAGFHVQSVGELRQNRVDYREAIPILLRWLVQVSYLPLKEDIVRTLSVPWAKPGAGRVLIEEFRRADARSSGGLRWAIANALEVVADDELEDEVVQLVLDPGFGRARQMLALALANMKGPRSVSALMDLLGDEEVVGHAVIALGRLGVAAALPDLEALIKHPKAWVRREATKAVGKIKSRS